MRTLGPAGRRAWIETMSTYLRNAEYLVYYDGAFIDICNADSLKLATPGMRWWGRREPAEPRESGLSNHPALLLTLAG